MKYTFICPKCNNEFEVNQSLKDYTGKHPCPACGAESHRTYKVNINYPESMHDDPEMEKIAKSLRHSHPSDHYKKDGSKHERGKIYY